MWGVWCTVYGGVTGFRASWLKSDGTTQEFESEVQATEEARDLNMRLGGYRLHSGATFHYVAKEFT